MNSFELQKVKYNRVSNLINATVTAILNSSFGEAVDNIERQAVIEVAQDFNMIDLAHVLIERNEIINN